MAAPVPSSAATTLQRARAPSRWRASLDGEKIATLMSGASITRELEPGRHRLRAHNTTRAFTVVNRPGRGTFGLLSLIGAR